MCCHLGFGNAAARWRHQNDHAAALVLLLCASRSAHLLLQLASGMAGGMQEMAAQFRSCCCSIKAAALRQPPTRLSLALGLHLHEGRRNAKLLRQEGSHLLVQVALQARRGWPSSKRVSQVPQSVPATQARSMGGLQRRRTGWPTGALWAYPAGPLNPRPWHTLSFFFQRRRGPGISNGGRQLGSSQPLTSNLAELI